MEAITTARFFRKPSQAWELEDDTSSVRPTPFRVTKMIELTARQYQHFASHLLADAPFIAANKDFMAYDEQSGVTRCLLVTARGRRDGILVDSQGFDYARYAAYVPDKTHLELRDVPMDHYNPRSKPPRPGQER